MSICASVHNTFQIYKHNNNYNNNEQKNQTEKLYTFIGSLWLGSKVSNKLNTINHHNYYYKSNNDHNSFHSNTQNLTPTIDAIRQKFKYLYNWTHLLLHTNTILHIQSCIHSVVELFIRVYIFFLNTQKYL